MNSPDRSPSPQTPIAVSLRAALSRALRSDEQVRAFAIDHAPEVTRRFRPDMDLSAKIDELLAHTDPQQLLDILQSHYPSSLSETPPIPDTGISNAMLRAVLNDLLRTDADQDAFVLDYYPNIYQLFTSGMDRVSKTNLFLDRLEDKSSALSNLQKYDPARFDKIRHLLPVSNPRGETTEARHDATSSQPTAAYYDDALPPTQQRGGQRGALNDLVAATDQLGFQQYVQAFADLIESPDTHTPLTIGIFGSWGCGKSFLLQHIVKELARRESSRKTKNRTGAAHVHVVAFNAWEYSALSAIWPGLIRKIMQHLEKTLPWHERYINTFFRNFRNVWKTHRISILLLTLLFVSMSASAIYLLYKSELTEFSWRTVATILGAAATLFSALFEPIKRTWEGMSDKIEKAANYLYERSKKQGYGGYIDTMAEIRKDLDYLSHSLENSNGRILITIDDLDRCEPQKAVEVLQSINLLLNFDRFIICLGIDARIITRAIEAHYKNLLGPAGASGYEYLDKMIQIPFRIPAPATADIQEYLGGILTPPTGRTSQVTATTQIPDVTTQAVASGEGATPSQSATLPGLASQAAQSATHGVGPRVAQADQAFSPDEVRAFQTLARFLRPNPRHLKRLVNVYRLVRILAEYRSDSDDRFILENPYITIRWLSICGQWPYTTRAMLYYFDELQERIESGRDVTLPSGDALFALYSFVKPHLHKARQDSLDHDRDLLEILLSQSQRPVTWQQLRILKKYTINFNPAVDSEGINEIPILFSRQPHTTTNKQQTPPANIPVQKS